MFAGDGAHNPGVVIYGNKGAAVYPFDFSLDSTNLGVEDSSNYLSSTQWLANSQLKSVAWYDHFYNLAGAPSTQSDLQTSGILTNGDIDGCTDHICYLKPTSGITVNGITAYSGKALVFIDGDLTINGNITLNASQHGFLAFMVKGTITVGTGVGGSPVDYATAITQPPNLEGFYVSDTFDASTGNTQLVGKGSFVANTFNLKRDLGSNNTQYPATIFYSNPRLLFDMPQPMLEVPVKWQEVAP